MNVEKIENIPIIFKKLILFTVDIAAIVCAYFFANIFQDYNFDFISISFLKTCFFAIAVYGFAFFITRVYRSRQRYSSAFDYILIGTTALASNFVIIAIDKIFKLELAGIRLHTLACIITIIECISARVFIRVFLIVLSNRNDKEKKRVLIIGAGEAASQVINNINHHMHGEYTIVGMIDDSNNKQGTFMYGVEVIGNRENIVNVVKDNKVDLILFTIQNINNSQKNDILDICSKTDIPVKVMLPIEKAIMGKSLSDSFRDFQVEDLLGRDPIQLDNTEISSFICGKVVLVTGAGGSIGSELCRQVARFQPKLLVMLDIYENTLYEIELELIRKNKDLNYKTIIASVRDKKRLEEIFNIYKPQVVFHAAAHKHVPLMENSPLEAIKNNVFGTYNVATFADKFNVEKFILVSTDKAVNPTNIMGATKRICEMIIQTKAQTSKTKFAAVRFGNVLGSHGSVIPIFKQQIAEGGPITITHREITRYFMLIPEAVGLILQAMVYAESGEIFVLDMGKPVKIYDLAKTMVKLSGKDINIEIVGLRPGEKLYEELLVAEEGLARTLHDKIMVSEIKPITEIELEHNLEKLKNLVSDEKNGIEEVKKVMKAVVPTYIDVAKEGQPVKKDNVKKQTSSAKGKSKHQKKKVKIAV